MDLYISHWYPYIESSTLEKQMSCKTYVSHSDIDEEGYITILYKGSDDDPNDYYDPVSKEYVYERIWHIDKEKLKQHVISYKENRIIELTKEIQRIKEL